ncbi:MAG: hypothetical protein E7665_03020 [Ruminococcaceae bacterium]|nr:hypothetical protein [Oscillospiraceae bacterium]
MDSEQVKSATDNIGTFDESNPDIRYSARTEDAENRTPDMSDIARSTVKIANAHGTTVETQDFADMSDNAPEALWNEASRKIVLNAKAKRNAAMLPGHEMFPRSISKEPYYTNKKHL